MRKHPSSSSLLMTTISIALTSITNPIHSLSLQCDQQLLVIQESYVAATIKGLLALLLSQKVSEYVVEIFSPYEGLHVILLSCLKHSVTFVMMRP